MRFRSRASTLRKRMPRRSLVPRGWLDWALAVGCVALVVLAIVSIGGSSTGAAASRRTATVSRGVVQSTVSGNGSLEAAQEVELDFGASGEVTAIDVEAGERVKKGQVLARVDASSARASLASAEAQLSEAEEALEAADESAEEEGEEEETAAVDDGGVTTVLAGYMVKEGTIEDGSSSAQTTAKKERAKKEREEKEREAEREREGEKGEEAAPEEGTPTKGKAEAPVEAEEPAAEEKVGAAAEEESEPTGEAIAEPSASTSTAAGGSESGGSAEVGSVSGGGASVSVPTAEANLREAQLSVRSARREVRETTLRAPISGTIASVSGAVGENVSGEASSGSASGGASESSSGALGATGGEATSSGTSSGSGFIVLAQLQRLKLEVSFSESDIGEVKVGQTATVAVDSLAGTELSGRVTKVNVLPSEGSSSVVEYPATILLTQSAEGLRAGMSASAEVVVEQVKNALSVTSEAIATGPSKTVTVEQGGEEVQKKVTTGLVGDETTRSAGGLKAGETVVLPEATVAAASGAEGESGAPGGIELGGFPTGGAGSFSGGPPSGAGFPGAP